MVATHVLMNDKEKKYVAYCFSKNSAFSKTNIDYERIFNEEEISYDLQESKKEDKQKFGKSTKRSRKWLRKSSNTETGFLEHKIIVSELMEMVSILKCIILDEENTNDMENTICSYFTSSFDNIICYEKIFDFLESYFAVISEGKKSFVVDFLIKKYPKVGLTSRFHRFLSTKCMDAIISPTTTIDDDLWNSENGIVVGIHLLKRDCCSKQIIASFLNSKVIYSEYLCELVQLLESRIATEEDKKKLVNKLKTSEDENIIEILEKIKF